MLTPKLESCEATATKFTPKDDFGRRYLLSQFSSAVATHGVA